MIIKLYTVYSISGCMQGVQVKLRDTLRMRAIPECLRGVITTNCYTNPRLPYLTLQGSTNWYAVIILALEVLLHAHG